MNSSLKLSDFSFKKKKEKALAFNSMPEENIKNMREL